MFSSRNLKPPPTPPGRIKLKSRPFSYYFVKFVCRKINLFECRVCTMRRQLRFSIQSLCQ